MFGTHDLALFALTVFVLNATPGVDMAFTLVSTLRGGIRGGLAAAGGVSAGCVVHALAATFGLAALMVASSAAFNFVKWAGAAYLLWLAVGMLRTALRAAPANAGVPDATDTAPLQPWAVFRQGFLTNVLNPAAPAAQPERDVVARGSLGQLELRAPLETLSLGRQSFAIELFAGDAPVSVRHIIALVTSHFYDGQRVHRAIPGFVVQFGDPQTRNLDARQAWQRHWEQHALRVASAIASRIVRREIDKVPLITLDLVREALQLAAGNERITLRLHPDDQATLGDRVSTLAGELGSLAEVRVVADPAITSGGCRVDTEFGSIDQQLEAQLDREEPAVRELHSLGELAVCAHLVDQSGELARMATVLAHLAFEAVDFLDHHDRDDDVVILEFE